MKSRSNLFVIVVLFVMTVFIILLGGYILIQLFEIGNLSREIGEAFEISQAALDFNVENFHTQLEVWEYAYEPNDKRWEAFKSHDNTLTDLLAYLVKLVDAEAAQEDADGEMSALTINGKTQVDNIASDLDMVRKDWENVFESVAEVRRLRDLGYSEVDSPNYLEYVDALKEANVWINKNEDLFDELEFNKEVDKFVVDQKDVVWRLHVKQDAIISGLGVSLGLLIAVLILFGTGLILYLVKFSKDKK